MAIETKTSVDVQSLPPFKRFIMSIGVLPTSYLESMTYAELVMWFCNFLQEQVIPAVNNNADAIREIQDFLNTLDLQDEVDHKLDEMAEDGTLQEIIAEYLNANALWCFDNVADMKEATNLIDGSFARTLGYYTKNKGGALYKIRTITNEDIVDEGSIIALHDENLIAELIIEDNCVLPEYFGAVADGTTNDSAKIQLAYNYAKSKGYTLLFNNRYYMETPIQVENNDKIVITGKNHKGWNTFGHISGYIKLHSSFMVGSDENTNNIYISISMSNIEFICDNINNTPSVFKYLNLFSSEIYNCLFKNVGYLINEGSITKVTHIHNNNFMGITCNLIKSTDPDKRNVGVSDSYIENNYINGNTSINQDVSVFYCDPDMHISNNYIDYFTFIFRSSRQYKVVQNIISANNIYELCYSMGYYDTTEASEDNQTVFSNCSFTNDKFSCIKKSELVRLGMPDLNITPRTFTITSISSRRMSICNCMLANCDNLLYSASSIYMTTTMRKYYKCFGNYVNGFEEFKFSDLFKCEFTNEQGSQCIYTDVVDTVTELPAVQLINGRKVIYNGDYYYCFNKTWHKIVTE